MGSGAVPRSSSSVSAAAESASNWADSQVPAASPQAPGIRFERRRETSLTDPAADDEGFIQVKRKRRSPASIGTAKSGKVLAVSRKPPTFALFVSRLNPDTSVSDIESLVAPFLDSNSVTVTKLTPKFPSYSSFHLAGDQSVFDALNKADVWPEGSIFHQFFGKLDSARVYVTKPSVAENASVT